MGLLHQSGGPRGCHLLLFPGPCPLQDARRGSNERATRAARESSDALAPMVKSAHPPSAFRTSPDPGSPFALPFFLPRFKLPEVARSELAHHQPTWSVALAGVMWPISSPAQYPSGSVAGHHPTNLALRSVSKASRWGHEADRSPQRHRRHPRSLPVMQVHGKSPSSRLVR